MKGLVAFSFGYRQNEKSAPCLSNIDLANAIIRIVDTERGAVLIVAQHEIAQLLLRLGCSNGLIFTIQRHRQEDQYLDSEEVMAQAAKILHERGVTHVISVAQPWLHSFKCDRLVRKYGFVLVRHHIGWIRFDRQSVQPWTRSLWHLLWFTFRYVFLGYRDHLRR